MKIVERLEGLVSESLIRDCLPEKYKIEYRSKNAKKQKRKHNKEINLAPLPVLNMKKYPEVEEEEKQHTKEVVLVGVDGREYHKREEDEKPYKTATEDDPDAFITGKISQSPFSPQLEQEHRFEEHEDHFDSEPEDPSLNDIDESEILEKRFEKSNQLTATVAGVSSTYTHDNNKPVLSFEFFVFFDELQKHMASLFQSKSGNRIVWSSGKIDKKTGRVISSSLGRINQQQCEL